MHLRFSFRSDFHELPEPIKLFEFVRAVYKSFETKPYNTYKLLEMDIVPMGQLTCGLYFSFKNDPEKIFEKFKNSDKDDELKLEMCWVVPGMVRIEVTNRGSCG